ncbi:MAG: nuclease-related domain-containing protein [Acidimicrobiales bacterium]
METVGSGNRGEGAEDQQLVVNRWRRYGKDYLYVSCGDDVKVGRVDLASGDVAVEDGHAEADLLAAAVAWGHDNDVDVRALLATNDVPPPPPPPPANAVPTPPAPPAPAPQVAPDPDPDPEPEPEPEPETEWVDLAGNRAGQAAREQAVALRQAAPVRTFLARALQVHTDERAWRVGADGEETLAWKLRKLGEEWRVLHAVPVGDKGSDIDHVVIGPGGVFTLNTKNHSGKKVWVSEKTLMIGGHRTQYLRNSRFEGTRASSMLAAACGFEVPVRPVIVLMCEELTIKSAPEDVSVVSIRIIRKWLQRRPVVLTAEQVEAIYDHARRDSTWR